ncbi:hypothetical protein FRACA_1390008 [Frankia canadensis]|uniref:Uncharacterized protein n=1 Tax=Frankia canadensis TaxID=1836972 RepID=A0A2I2KL37_9ACTN|nr:hypothetical protein FRACA_1390008 [Frankia canadensis]SOU53682.1 hypothetical protein FRACA_1390008 [Frankia canadensis]
MAMSGSKKKPHCQEIPWRTPSAELATKKPMKRILRRTVDSARQRTYASGDRPARSTGGRADVTARSRPAMRVAT